MPRPKVSLDTQRRLYQVARDVSDDVSPNPSHEEALTAVLDHVESQVPAEETQIVAGEFEDLLNQGQERDAFGGFSDSL